MKAVDEYIPLPPRNLDKDFLMPVEDVFSIAGRGTVVTGRIEQGKIKVGDDLEIVGLKPAVKSTCTGVEMFKKNLDQGQAGDNVGILLRGLKREEMSVPARVMGIADIFEALTAKDRPYKRGKTLSESLQILGKFCTGGHIDPDLFDIFVREKVYLEYAQAFLDKNQIDSVDESNIPGYRP